MRHRRARSSAKRRSMDWYHANFYGYNIQFGSPGSRDVAVRWAIWPTGNGDDPDNPGTPIEPDVTLVKTIASFNIGTDNGSAQAKDPGFGAVGLIAWDAIDPVDNVVVPSTEIPDPLDGTHDWLWRVCFTTLYQNNTGTFVNTDLASQSKAMRKLPKNTGVLACVSWEQPGTSDDLFVTWAFDWRMLVKKAP